MAEDNVSQSNFPLDKLEEGQKFEIFKTIHHTYYKITNKINRMIEEGAIIQSVTPLVVNQHFSDSKKFSKETEILVFILYKEGTGNNDKNS